MTDNTEIILVEPSRLRMGLWGYEEGDIYRAYSGDIYGEHKRIRKPFQHGAYLYTNMGNCFGSDFLKFTSKCYPLVPECVFDEVACPTKAYCYTGRSVQYQGKSYRLGNEVEFQQRPLTQEEVIDLSRRKYAYGAWFASKAGSYQQCVREFLSRIEDKRVEEILLSEISNTDLPQSQEDMRTFIESAAKCDDQLTLFDAVALGISSAGR